MATKLLWVALALICLFGFAWYTQAQQDAKGAQGRDENLAKLAKLRLDAAEKAYRAWDSFERQALPKFSDLPYQLSVRWLAAELELAAKKEQRVVAYESHFRRMKQWGEILAATQERADSPPAAVVSSFQIEAEYWVAKERAVKNK